MEQKLPHILGKPTWKLNPLTAVGIASSILSLDDLTTDELHDHCLKSARDLFVRFHEDRREKSPAQMRFSEAFNLLKDRTTFELALHELRTKRSDERMEVNLLKQEVASLKSQRDQQRKQIDACGANHGSLEERSRQLQHLFERYLSGDCLDLRYSKNVTSLGCQSIGRLKWITLLSLRYERGRSDLGADAILKSAESELTQLRGQYRAGWDILKEEQVNRLTRVLIKKGATSYGVGMLFMEAQKAGLELPGIEWGPEIALQKLGLGALAGRKQFVRFPPQTKPTVSTLAAEDFTKRYEHALRDASELLTRATPTVQSLELRLAHSSATAGHIELPFDSFVILGCIAGENVSRLKIHETASLATIDVREGLQYLEPFVTPDSIVVAARPIKLSCRTNGASATRNAVIIKLGDVGRLKQLYLLGPVIEIG